MQRGYRFWVVLVGLSLSAAGCSDRQAADQRIIVQDERALGGAFVTGDVATVETIDEFAFRALVRQAIALNSSGKAAKKAKS